MKNSATRREFLKSVAAASLATGLPTASAVEAETSKTGRVPEREKPGERADRSRVEFPRLHTGRQLARVSFPLGGIGTGGIGLGGRGNLQDWEIFNQPNRGYAPRYAFPCLWARRAGAAPYSAVLERRYLPPYDVTDMGLSYPNAPGLPRLAEARFLGSFPLARVEFLDADCPVHVALEAFSPFQPLDADASGLPCALLSYEVHNPASTAIEVAIAWNIENPVSLSGKRRNRRLDISGLHGLSMEDPSMAVDDPMHGSFVLATLTEDERAVEVLEGWQEGGWYTAAQHFWFGEFSKTGHLGDQSQPSLAVGSVAIRQTIPPGAKRSIRFLVAWHFPNRTPERCGWTAPKGEGKAPIGNYYSKRFSDAWAVAQYAAENLTALEAGTHDFVNTLRTSTLPDVVKEAASANLSTLVSNTSFRIADGSFQGFEGSGDKAGRGFGTCTHVWNYEVATQFLFPSLARSMRATNFGYSTDADGHMDFRHMLPYGKEHWGAAAADGQMGQIVKLYFDWKLSGDDAWLRTYWPAVQRALAYAWRPGGWDGNKDGVMEGVQHTTYDVEFYGPNPLCGTWYLAALRACAAMALAMGDASFAHECTELADRGSRWIDANLFNGEYYFQQIRSIPKDQIAPGLIQGMGPHNPMKPDFQPGLGCLLDQLIGQYMATIAGLGPLLQEESMRTALQSMLRYNYKHSMNHYPSVERTFAVNDEAALVNCEYMPGQLPEKPLPYYSEVFTGVEYSTAVLMMAQGMVEQGIECMENTRLRYDGEKANPFDELEFGRHYARPMASWAAIPILSGFQYDGRTHHLGINPIWQAEKHQSFWSTPTAWGSFRLGTHEFLLKPVTGSIPVKELRLPWQGAGDIRVFQADKKIAPTVHREKRALTIAFAGPIDVTQALPLKIVRLPSSQTKA